MNNKYCLFKKIVYCSSIFSLFYLVNNAKSSGESSEKGNQAQNTNAGAHEQKKSQHPSGNPVKNYILEQLAKLMTTCIIIRIDDFTLYKVTTTSRNPIPKEFVTGMQKSHSALNNLIALSSENISYEGCK